MIKYIFSLLTFVVFVSITSAQQIEPQNGVYQSDNTLYAITNVTIHINSSQKILNGTLLFQNGKIKKVGLLKIIPKNVYFTSKNVYFMSKNVYFMSKMSRFYV